MGIEGVFRALDLELHVGRFSTRKQEILQWDISYTSGVWKNRIGRFRADIPCKHKGFTSSFHSLY